MANRTLFGLIVGLFSSYFFTRWLRVNWSEAPDFIKFQLTDLLFVPLMGCVAWLVTRIIKRDPKLRLPWYYAYVLVLLSAIYFEWYLPNFKSHVHPYTSDWMDVVMYLIGGIIFHLLARKNSVS